MECKAAEASDTDTPEGRGKIAKVMISDAGKAEGIIPGYPAQQNEQDDEEEKAEKKMNENFGAYWQSLRALGGIRETKRLKKKRQKGGPRENTGSHKKEGHGRNPEKKHE